MIECHFRTEGQAMKTIVHGNQVNYELQGSTSAPVVMLSHALATNLSIWDRQLDVLKSRFCILRYDTLGHGQTDAPPGPYTLDQLVGQAGGLLDALGIERVHFLGLSMGGMIGQMLALARPEAIQSLVLCSSSSRFPPESQPLWQERVKIAESDGMEPLIEPTINRWFTGDFRSAQREIVDQVRAMIRGTSPAGYAACCHAISALNITDAINAIKAPTLIMVGAEDQGTPVAMSQKIHERIVGSELLILSTASHLSNIEQFEAFNNAVMKFLDRFAAKA